MILRTVKDFAALAKDRRRARGWSQQELADRLGVNRDWVTNFEHGKTTVHFGLVLRALRELGVSLEAPLLGDAPNSSAAPAAVREDPAGYEIDLVNLDELLNAPPEPPPVFGPPIPSTVTGKRKSKPKS